MKICLINPSVDGKRGEFYEYEPNFNSFPHLGLGYIASVLERNNYSVDIIECQAQQVSTRELAKKLQTEQYDLIGISTYFYNIHNVVKIVEVIKIKLPSAFIFAGGYLATLSPESVLEKCEKINCCVIGEGEITCLELADAIRENKDTFSIKGLAYKSGEKIIFTPYRKYVENLDALPIPKRAYVSPKVKMVGLLTSRGCYGRCNFCGQSEFYDKCLSSNIRYRSAENVVEEIVYLKNNINFNKLFIHDDNFIEGTNDRKKWLNRFYELMKEKGLSFKYIRIDARANDVVACKENLRELKEIGLTNIFIGIESLIQRQLDFFNKGSTVEQNIEAIKICGELGIKLEFGFLTLEPFVTLEELLENYTTLESTKFYDFTSEQQDLLSLGVRRLRAVPGTKVHTFLENQGLIVPNEFYYEFRDDRVSLFYEILMSWKNKVGQYMPLFYLINKAEYYVRFDIVNMLNQEYFQLKKYDIDIVIDLCKRILDREIVNIENSSGLIGKWEEAFKPILIKLMKAKEEMEQYS